MFNSSNIEQIAGRSFDLLVCAGAPAAKWKANREPEADRANLHRLVAELARVRAQKVVLISTVDVYPDPAGVDEDSAISSEALGPYGRHRRELEQELERRFPSCVVVRLPALFGEGLKKNAVYDLLTGNLGPWLVPDAAYQFYDLGELWTHLDRALAAGVARLNLATEPLGMRRIAREAFQVDLDQICPPVADGAAPSIRYDMHTRHAALFGREGQPYLRTADEVLQRLIAFVRRQRGDRQ